MTKQDEGQHWNPALKSHPYYNAQGECYGPYRKQHRKPNLPMTCHINKHSPHTLKKPKGKLEIRPKNICKLLSLSKGQGHKYFIYNFYLESSFSTNDLAPAGICKVALLCSPGRRPRGQILLLSLKQSLFKRMIYSHN